LDGRLALLEGVRAGAADADVVVARPVAVAVDRVVAAAADDAVDAAVAVERRRSRGSEDEVVAGGAVRPDDGIVFVAVNVPIAMAAAAKTPQSAMKRR
jgi:hypothetical protein